MAGEAQVHGFCHCGSLAVSLEFPAPLDAIKLHACQCNFCRSHGATTVFHKEGRALIRAASPTSLIRYRFELATADFLLCAHCGVYAGALLSEGDKAWTTTNVAGMRIPEFLERDAEPVSYSGESAHDRIARRKANWTPATLEYDPSLGVARLN
jgi:hypothetical protein